MAKKQATLLNLWKASNSVEDSSDSEDEMDADGDQADQALPQEKGATVSEAAQCSNQCCSDEMKAFHPVDSLLSSL